MLPEAAVPQGDPAGVAVEHSRVWLDWAASHVDACLTDNCAWTERLLRALEQLPGSGRSRSSSPASHQDESVSRGMAAVVVAVQSQDRVTQRLTHLAEALRHLRAQLGDTRRCGSAESWGHLREAQLRLFSMAEERMLFRHMVTHARDGDDHDHDDHDGSDAETGIELFDMEHRSGEPAT